MQSADCLENARRVVVWALVSLALAGVGMTEAAESGPWQDLDPSQERALASMSERLIIPRRYRTVIVDWAALEAILSAAPLEATQASQHRHTALILPLPDGNFGKFRIEESPIMAPAMAASLPDVKTFRGVGMDDASAIARLDTTPAGFHAMIRTGHGTVYIDPYARGERDVYLVYDKRDFPAPEEEQSFCRVGTEEIASPLKSGVPPLDFGTMPNAVTSGATYKQINLAVAATGEYTGFHGGKVPDAQAAIVTTINRVNLVYELELAIRMNLVDNAAIVYTNAATDPYSNSCTGSELTANQNNLDSVIGASNYDLGHVMGGPGGGGGLAGVGPCLRGFTNGNFHARGCTGLDMPIGDPFDIDYVAHEIGHQWGAPHTFNGTVSSCGGGNRSSNAAYEPGSGSTIMAYAGICGSDNLQNNSDDYFHSASLETIASYDPTTFGAAQCIQMTASGNMPPTADAGMNRFIPRDTPFTLCGTGTDADPGDNLTYLWEEFDLGPDPGGPPNNASSAPFFRTFDATVSNCRTFPKLADILNNTQTNGEILPNVAWPMNFRLTVFDNHPGAVGGGFDQDDIEVTVSAAAGPFRLTSPNTAVTWTGGTSETVTWDVAGTTAAPINCANVDIWFSTDGGTTFATTVLANTANDGSEAITVPNVSTTAARLKLSCSDNVFFDINDVNFSVEAVICTDDAFEAEGSGSSDDACFGADLGALPAGQTHLHCDEDWVWFSAQAGKTYVIETSNLVGAGSDTSLSVQKVCGAEIDFDDNSGAGTASRIEWTSTTDTDVDVRIRQVNDDYGPGLGYDISVSEVCSDSMVLANQSVSTLVSFVADNDIVTGPNFQVEVGGSANFSAGNSVAFGNGTSIAGGLAVAITPNPCP